MSIPYSKLNIIQKINVKGNTRSYGERYRCLPGNFMAMKIALYDFDQFRYETPFLFSGANPVYGKHK